MDPGYGYEDPSLAADPNAEYAGVDEGQLEGVGDHFQQRVAQANCSGVRQ